MDKKMAQTLAEKAGFTWLTTKDLGDELAMFATLVEQSEREACAKWFEEPEQDRWLTPEECAEAMRARSNLNQEA